MNGTKTWKKLTALLVATALTAGLLAGCGGGTGETQNTESGQPDPSPSQSQTAETRTVTDMSGVEVEIPAEVTRYADAWYAHNEVIIMLDQAEGLVATVMTPEAYPWTYFIQPNMYDALSTFGSEFNLEELVALEPDVVFATGDSLREQLASVGIPLVNVGFSNYDEMKQSISLTAEVLGGEAIQIAEDYITYLDDILATLEETVSTLTEDELVTVLHGDRLHGDLTVDGADTIIDSWITAAGGTNAAAEVSGTYQTVTLEQILAWDPDVIITSGDNEVEAILQDPEWAGLTAVQNGQVYINPKGVFYWDRYGVEEALQLQWTANLLHPDLFDIDIREEIKSFYETFLNNTLTDDQVERILNAQDPE